jgi:hypothetical protein
MIYSFLTSLSSHADEGSNSQNAGTAPFQPTFDPGREFPEVLIRLCHDDLVGANGNFSDGSINLNGGVYERAGDGFVLCTSET